MYYCPFTSRRAWCSALAALWIGTSFTPAIGAETPLLRIQGALSPGLHLLPALAEGFLHQLGVRDVQIAIDGERVTIRGDTGNDGQAETIEIVARDTGLAFSCLRDRQCDVGVAGAAINDLEYSALGSAGFGNMRSLEAEHVVALDGVAIIVNNKNPLTRISREQLRSVLTGAISSWPEIGTLRGPIHLYGRDNTAGTTRILRRLVSGAAPLAASMQLLPTNAAVANAVAQDYRAMGYTPPADIAPARSLAVYEQGSEPRFPSLAAIKTEDYLLTRRIYLYVPALSANPFAQRFAHYAISDAGQAVVERAGYVSLSIKMERAPKNLSANDPYNKLVAGAQRLSVSLRFHGADGQDGLDNRSLRDVARVAEFLKQRNVAEHSARRPRVTVIGFADDDAGAAAEEVASRRFAEIVAHALAAQGLKVHTIAGLGPRHAVASNAQAEGREKNRRVELWVR